ncbi:uncharacterized protein LOC143281175 [Babylonia areolata]|uniref:uncharacterized protein LOC143281175 n=1 Tax=Babylonia areolata TaxID=304850 RepID=UPI003FD3E898
MPSTITPIEQTRGFAVRPAQGLRFGNFEGAVHLPPVKHSSAPAVGVHSFSTLNNQHIYRTVTDWVQSWQPWQHKVLLYSIVNRCTLPQLEILATTLEPMRHRDPLAVSRRKSALLPITPSTKSSASFKSSAHKIPRITTSEQLPAKTSQDTDKDRLKTPQDSAVKTLSQESESDLKTQENDEGQGGKPEKMTRCLDIDQYASMVSSAVLVAALGEVSMADKLGNIMKAEMITESSKPGSEESKSADHGTAKVEIVSTDDPPQTSDLSSAVVKNVEISQHPPPPTSSGNGRPGILRSSSGKRADRSRNTSAQFLGGRILFTPTSRQSRRSGSSRYRYSAFASSAASTPDFFFREKISTLGPMRRTIRTGPVQRPMGVGQVPVPVQRFYKNRCWWSGDLPHTVQLQSAQKQELSSSFREQLAAVYQWLQQWETHERLSLLKEVLKVCSGDVLESLVLYLHQKLRDTCDINRLPDKLLLYVLSHLAPKDILNAAQVCRRWRYLCAMDDLWIVKCLELGEKEGLDNVPQLVRGANVRGRGVDWMLAYMELHTIVTTLRDTDDLLSSAAATHRDGQTQRGQEDGKAPSKGGRVRRRIRIRSQTEGAGGDTASEDTPETQGSGKQAERKAGKRGVTADRRDVTADRDSDVGSGVSEELSALMAEDERESFLAELSSRPTGYSKGQRRSLRSKVEHRIEETLSEGSAAQDKADGDRSSSGIRGGGGRQRSGVKVKDEEEETALDIHTDLSQSTDLLGKVVPSMSLEWQTPEHDDDFVRYPVYAGKVMTVQKVRKVQGHLGGIQCLQFDRRRLITGGVDRVVRLWDVRSGRSVHRFHGHKGGVRCVKFDDDILVTGSWDSVIFVWDIRHFTQITVLHGHDNSVSCLKLHENFVISGSHDHTVRVWSRPTYMCTLVLRGHSGPVLSVEADQDYVYSTAADLTIRMTDLMTGMCERVFERANTSPINCLTMNGSLLLGGDGEGRVYFWNVRTGEAEAAVKVHEASVNTIQYHNGRFYTGSSDGTMTEYDLVTMTCLRVLRGHKGAVRAIQVSDRRFVSCSDDGSVRIWDLVTDKTTSLSSVF